MIEDQWDVVHLTQWDLARRWRMSHRTLERWRQRGIGVPYLKIGGRVAYSLSDVEAFEAAQKRLPVELRR